MLENLFNLIKDQAGDSVINNPVVPNEQNEAVVASAAHSVAEELQGTLASGGLQNVLSLFNDGGSTGGFTNNPIVSNIISNFTNKLRNNHGIEGNQASNIANSLIPGVISNLISKTNNPGDSSFDINSIIGSPSGGGSRVPAGGGGFDFNNILGKIGGAGLDSDGDGKVELSDIVSKVTGAARQARSGSGGGLMDMIKGFVK